MKPLDRAVTAVLVVAFALVAAAMFVPEPKPRPLPTDVPLTPAAAGYREGMLGHPSSINPLTARSQVDRDLVALLFRGLVHLGPDGTLLPDLALTWTATADGKSYTFTIRRDAAWEDGTALTTDDVAFTVGLLQSKAYDGPLGASWHDVTATVLDAHRIRFDMQIPTAGFLQMATLPILPRHLLAATPVTELADSGFSKQPLGSGPFRLVSLDERGAKLARVRGVPPNPGLFPSSGPTPLATPTPALELRDTVETIDLRFYDSAPLLAADFAAGDLDAVGGLPPTQLAEVEGVTGAKRIVYPRSVLTAVVLNQRADRPAFRNADVRRGLLAAIDRDALVALYLGGHGSRAEIPIPSSSWAYDSAAVTRVPFDTAAARQSLARAGWDGRSDGWYLPKTSTALNVKLLTPDQVTNPTAYLTASQVAASWRGIGLAVTLEALPAAQYVSALAGGGFDAAVVDVEIGLDPDLSPLLLSTQAGESGTNLSGIQSTALDKLLLAARGAVDPAARKKALGELERYLSTEQPILPLYFHEYTFVVAARVQGPTVHEVGDPSDRYWDVLDWRLASDG